MRRSRQVSFRSYQLAMSWSAEETVLGAFPQERPQAPAAFELHLRCAGWLPLQPGHPVILSLVVGDELESGMLIGTGYLIFPIHGGKGDEQSR